MVIVAGDEDGGVRYGLPAHYLAFPPSFEFGGGVASSVGFVAVGERDGNSGDVKDEGGRFGEDGVNVAVPVGVGGEDLGDAFEYGEIVVVCGCGVRLAGGVAVLPVIARDGA
jgi:hypothetical protein